MSRVLSLCCILSDIDHTKSAFFLEADIIKRIVCDLRDAFGQPRLRGSRDYGFFLVVAEHECLRVDVDEIENGLV